MSINGLMGGVFLGQGAYFALVVGGCVSVQQHSNQSGLGINAQINFCNQGQGLVDSYQIGSIYDAHSDGVLHSSEARGNSTTYCNCHNDLLHVARCLRPIIVGLVERFGLGKGVTCYCNYVVYYARARVGPYCHQSCGNRCGRGFIVLGRFIRERFFLFRFSTFSLFRLFKFFQGGFFNNSSSS